MLIDYCSVVSRFIQKHDYRLSKCNDSQVTTSDGRDAIESFKLYQLTKNYLIYTDENLS